MREIESIRPAHLVMWKNDPLGRNVKDVLVARELIRAAGCRIHYIEGLDPSDDPDSFLSEVLIDAVAAYYSKNIRRGQSYNAERAPSNGHKIFGFTVDADKRDIPDPETAPIITQIFDAYAHGTSMQKIADRLNAQGVRTTRGYRFTPKSLNKMLKNRAYIGEYSYGTYITAEGDAAAGRRRHLRQGPPHDRCQQAAWATRPRTTGSRRGCSARDAVHRWRASRERPRRAASTGTTTA